MRTKKDLRDYQKTAVKLATRSNKYLAIDMGLGKTITSLTIIKKWLKLGSRGCLYVAPKYVMETVTQEQAADWKHTRKLTFSVLHGPKKADALKTPADIYLINPEGVPWLWSQVLAWSKQPKRIREENPLPFDALVVDEGTRFKTTGVRWRKLKGLRKFFDRVVVMSGRPAPNSYLELWPQVFLLDGGEALGSSFTTFRATYFKADYMGFSWEPLPGSVKAINKKLRHLFFTVDQSRVKLPPIITNVVRCRLPAALLRDYKDFQKKKVLELADGQKIVAFNSMARTIKLQQYAQGLIYTAAKQTSQVHQIKWEALEDLVASQQGKPVLVAYNFRHELDFLKSKLKAPHLGAGLKKGEAKAIIEKWNRGKIPVLLIHPQTGSHGLNIQFGGSTLVWYSPVWSNDYYEQMVARLRRPGQKSQTVIIHQIAMEDTIDVRIYKSLTEKQKVHKVLIDYLLKEVKSQ